MGKFNLKEYLNNNPLLKENIETLLSPEDLEYYRAHRDEIEDILHAEWRSSKLSAKDAVEKHKQLNNYLSDEEREDKLQQAKRGGGKESTLRKLAAIGKHSQSKKSLKEDIDPSQKKYTEEEWKYELDLNGKMAARLLDHQANGGEWGDLVDDLMTLQKQSRIPGNIEFFKEWIIDQEDNKLPNSSSGSFFTGLTDTDGLLSAMNFEEYDEETDVELYTDEEYDKAQKYHLAVIYQEAPDWSKY